MPDIRHENSYPLTNSIRKRNIRLNSKKKKKKLHHLVDRQRCRKQRNVQGARACFQGLQSSSCSLIRKPGPTPSSFFVTKPPAFPLTSVLPTPPSPTFLYISPFSPFLLRRASRVLSTPFHFNIHGYKVLP